MALPASGQRNSMDRRIIGNNSNPNSRENNGERPSMVDESYGMLGGTTRKQQAYGGYGDCYDAGYQSQSKMKRAQVRT